MAKKPAAKNVKTVTTIEEERQEPGGEVELENDESALPGDEDADAFAELEALAGTGARYEVRRTAPAGYTGYCGTYERDAFSLDRLFTEWGGGNFTIRVRGAGGTMGGSKQIQLAGTAHHKADAPAPAAHQHQAPDSGLAAVLNSINASNEARAKAADAQTKLLTDLVIGLINKPAPVLPAPPDPLAMISSLKDILKPDRGDSGADAVKLLLQGVTLGKELGGGGDSDTSMADVALKGFDTLKELAAVSGPPAAPARAVQRRPALPRPSAPGTVPATEPAAAPQAPPNNAAAEAAAEGAAPVSDTAKQIAWIKQQTVMLCRLAHAEKDPELYAEVFLDNIPEFVTEEMIHEQMKKPDAVARLAFINGNVKRYAPWFEQFRKEVVELIETPDDGIEDDTGEDHDDTGGDVLESGDDVGDVVEPMPDSGGGDDGQGG